MRRAIAYAGGRRIGTSARIARVVLCMPVLVIGAISVLVDALAALRRR